MADLVPVSAGGGSLFDPLTDPAGGSVLTRMGTFARQPAVRRTWPWLGGLAGAGALALTWATLAPAPQRMLYSQLGDSEKAAVVAALDKAGIAYSLDDSTGALTVDADQLYKARMLVAADGALATPETGAQTMPDLPLGASRALEGDRLRAAREHELTMTIMQIDGVEGARVHLAEPDRSVFVRDDAPASASVMVRLARGRHLSAGQVMAIVNLVAGSVPGLAADAVQVVDQQGELLSSDNKDNRGMELQAQLEAKLRNQVSALLTPMLGQGNFSSEIQVDLDMDEVTLARESYDKDGVVRSESESRSQSGGGAGLAQGIPGATSNTPPPATVASPGPPQGTPTTTPASGTAPANGDSSLTRNYELGRQVSVNTSGPGRIRRISVAVALSQAAMAKGKAADVEQIKQLVAAAVGANPQRGDQVAVAVRPFAKPDDIAIPFYETTWFALAARSAVALLGVLLVLLLAVRPVLKALRPADRDADDEAEPANDEAGAPDRRAAIAALPDPAHLDRQVGLARQLVDENPESALVALRQMLAQPGVEAAS